MGRNFTIGLVGARGYVGRELVRVIEHHPSLRIAFVASRSSAGQPVEGTQLVFEDVRPEYIQSHPADAYVLALGNGEAAPYVDAINAHHPGSVVVDISADHRFDEKWAYGLPEHHRERIRSSKRIANPGCYATAAQLGLKPLMPLLDGIPSVFGLSGYSGAGATPSPRNDVNLLRDNIMPYALTGHTHEKEVSAQLGSPVFFMPHVAPFFRGLVVTISATLKAPISAPALMELHTAAYGREPLIKITKDAPLPRDAVDSHGATIGGFSVDEKTRHAVLCVTLDNLLKGAATQAVQNLNLALGLDELEGLQR